MKYRIKCVRQNFALGSTKTVFYAQYKGWNTFGLWQCIEHDYTDMGRLDVAQDTVTQAKFVIMECKRKKERIKLKTDTYYINMGNDELT